MATKGKESAQGKERRGISPTPHQANTTQCRRSPSPSTTAPSSIDHKDGIGPTQSEKRVPNYLKPTISSSTHDPSMQTKKQTSSTGAKKPLLNRRRSLEKPPSPSQMPKTRTSPSPVDRIPPSSSVLPKTSTKPKTQTERLSKAPRKSHSFSARSVGGAKKSTSTSTIKKPISETSSEATTKAASPPTGTITSPDHVANTSRPESEQEDRESLLSEVEKEMVAKVESDNDVPSEISILEENDDVDMVQAELENEEEEEQLVKPCEPSNIIEEGQNAYPPSGEMKEPVDEVHVEETSDDHHEGGEEEEHATEESDKNHPEESFVEEPKVEGEEKEGEEVTSEISERKALDEKVEVDDGSQTLNSKEREEEEGVAKEAKPEAKNVLVKSQGVQGKKDASPASNDVIEETASKLLEKRKHKVQALVGAFETVISLQEPEA